MKLTHLTLWAITASSNAVAASAPYDQALLMLESIKARGQATLSSTGGTGLIQIGIFWQALATVVGTDTISEREAALRPLLSESLASTVAVIANASDDATLPLDRFSLGADMATYQLQTGNNSFRSKVGALNKSLALQPLNSNGGLWYYNNPSDITGYQNLSYLDGMFSYAPFVTKIANISTPIESFQSALEQVQILHDLCRKPSGLLVHGYDAIGAHAWANSTTGASPEVWGRSLAWYSLGLLNTLEAAILRPDITASAAYCKLHSLFRNVMDAQKRAALHSKARTGKLGVWQVVDRPGQSGNFIEASSSFMTAYTMLRGTRLNLIEDIGRSQVRGDNESKSYRSIAAEIYTTVSQDYLVAHHNGSLSLNGTSSIASLSGQNVSYEYYVTRPTEMDSLLGTSAFVLASYEMAKL